MKIHLNDVTGISYNNGNHVIIYQGQHYKINTDTYVSARVAIDQFHEWSAPIRKKILELQREIYNYSPIVIEVNQ